MHENQRTAPVGSILPDPPPTRCIARHPQPANDALEGSPVEGADIMAAGSWSNNEPTENRRSAADGTLTVAGLRFFLVGRLHRSDTAARVALVVP